MNYDLFFADVLAWIKECNQVATKHGMQGNEFWEWVMRSAGELGNKYENNDLVVMQMVMLIEWLEKFYVGGEKID